MFYCDKKFIGKTLQTMRKKADIKQSELAEKIGISEKHLSKIETGKNFPSLDNFLKMAEVLNFDLADFGINVNTDNNSVRSVGLSKLPNQANNTSYGANFSNDKQALLKMVYSSNDREAQSYLEILQSLNKILGAN